VFGKRRAPYTGELLRITPKRCNKVAEEGVRVGPGGRGKEKNLIQKSAGGKKKGASKTNEDKRKDSAPREKRPSLIVLKKEKELAEKGGGPYRHGRKGDCLALVTGKE